MKTRTSWIIVAVGVLFIGALAFVPADVRAQDQSDGGEWGLVEDGTVAEDLETKVNTTVDLVTPCRIVDTRRVGGFFTPGQRREYYVYGTLDVSRQGGNPFGCPAPRGEPKGVIINVTAVPVAGSGNFRVYPANVNPPQASLVNYRAGVQNIANAASVETYEVIGPREIEVQNSFGFAHLVIDIMGYYD